MFFRVVVVSHSSQSLSGVPFILPSFLGAYPLSASLGLDLWDSTACESNETSCSYFRFPRSPSFHVALFRQFPLHSYAWDVCMFVCGIFKDLLHVLVFWGLLGAEELTY